MVLSSLQIGLAALGAAVLAGVALHGAWVSRRSSPRQAAPEPGGAAPSVLDERIEPSLDAAALELAQFPLPQPEKKPGLDALLDAIATIALDGPVSGDAALAALPPTRRAGSKPFAVEGLNEENATWELPVAGRRYGLFQAGVQLANRAGALNEIEYSEFVMKTQAFSDAIGGTPDFPDMLDEVARARELDQFASAHDAQLELLLRARSTAWSPGYVQQNAARLGFVAGAIPGRMVIPAAGPGLPPTLGLGFDTQAALAEDPTQAAIRELVLSLDVPQVARSEQPFDRMRELALGLAEAMDGVVTDDRGTALSLLALDQIGADLSHLYDTLEQRDLAAGSALARRLFS
ncbi:MAG: cell division protein FtsZ [Rhodoferax sp.]|nr:cell division protein FtsZ [Rhodoferax sp.]